MVPLNNGVRRGPELLSGDAGSVLYAALEDNNRHLKSRLGKLGADSSDWPEQYHLATQWPCLDAGGLDAIDCAASVSEL